MEETVNTLEAKPATGTDFKSMVVEGLRSKPKRLPTVLLYDKKGSELFEEITRSKDYYLTRAEIEIFEDHAAELCQLIPDGVRIVEPGAGDGTKLPILFDALRKTGHCDIEYVPIDICKESIDKATESLAAQFPWISVNGIVGEYASGFEEIERREKRPAWVLFLGSNIGNYERPEDENLLRMFGANLHSNDGCILGVDLVKDPDILQLAYDDREGLTKRFNLNVIDQIRKNLGSSILPENFDHKAVWNREDRRMESYLVATRGCSCKVGGYDIHFEKGERIWIECSNKYEKEEIAGMARRTGFIPMQCYGTKAYQVSVLRKN